MTLWSCVLVLASKFWELKLTTRLNKRYSHLHLIAFSNTTHIETRWMNKISSGMTEISSSQISGQQKKLPSLMYLFQCRSKNKPPSLLTFLPTTTPHLAEAARRQWGLWTTLDCPLLHPVITTPKDLLGVHWPCMRISGDLTHRCRAGLCLATISSL